MVERSQGLVVESVLVTVHSAASENRQIGLYTECHSLVIQNCEIIADGKLEPNKNRIKSYFGRPWSPFSTTMVMQSQIGDFLLPEGWMKWDPTNGYEKTCEYREYANRGPGANTARRVNWPGFRAITDPKQAEKYTVLRFARGAIRALKPSGVPFLYGFAR
ncbi:pectinesterase family protein [Ralstonia pseudosolanacearum]|uniref:pectinesterase family protein n=1 Tax=Ralstonia pseudosolanacearum TaxID=1310165 RepID=UPI003CF07B8E